MAQEGAQPGPAPTFRSNVQEVSLDVVVRDSRGRPVKNLQAGDLQVYENGVRQELRSFRFVQGRQVVQQSAGKRESKAADDDKVSVITNPLRAINLVCIVFHNLDPYTKKFAMETAQEFLKNQFQPDTWVAVFSLDSQLTVLHPFTMNRAEVVQAAARAFTGTTVDFSRSADALLSATPNTMNIQVAVNGNPATGGSVSVTEKVSGGELNTLATNGADTSNDAGANAVRGNLADQRRAFSQIEGMRQTDQVLAMIGQLRTLPGRKTVLLLSTGLATTGDTERFKSIVDKANHADISIYALDVNGLSLNSTALASGQSMSHAAGLSATQGQANAVVRGTTGIATDSSIGGAGASMEKARQSDYVNDAVRTSDTQASLRALAEGTGGFLIANTNDFRKPFQRLIEDVDTHYEVIYRPSDNKLNGHLRTIEVKTARADLVTQSRTGYFALPPNIAPNEPASFELAALTALSLTTPPHAFDLQSTAYQFRPAATGSQETLALELTAGGLAATPEPSVKKHRVHVSLLALVTDANGQVVDKFSQDTPAYHIPDDQLAAAQKSALVFTHALSLAPGHYTVETAALDREANKASVNRFEAAIPERKGVGISSIVLVQHVEPVNGKVDAADPFQFQARPTQGVRVTPELATHIAADTQPNVYFVVYPDKSIPDKPKIQVELRNAGKLLANQSADLPAADETGAIPMVIKAPAVTGECDLRITAVQGSSQSAQSLAYTIAAK